VSKSKRSKRYAHRIDHPTFASASPDSLSTRSLVGCGGGLRVDEPRVAAQQALQLTIHWDKTTAVSKSSPTLQVDVNPRLEHGRPLSIAASKTVKVQGASYARYVP
jgi:hypothetical protein